MDVHTKPATRRPSPEVLSRRITDRRVELGLSEDELAAEAGMAPRYLRHLRELGVDFDPGGFVRIAAALHMSYRELLEGFTDLPSGQHGPGPHPALERLDAAECWDRLGARGVGHVALPGDPAPGVYPVNYAVVAETIVYRTAPNGPAAPASGTEVSFQADRIDERSSTGWSVLLDGRAERVEDPADVRHLAELNPPQPWAGGERPLWVRIKPDDVSGRRIATPG